jgi:hypothetical protein
LNIVIIIIIIIIQVDGSELAYRLLARRYGY